jgi:hypothetical protein
LNDRWLIGVADSLPSKKTMRPAPAKFRSIARVTSDLIDLPFLTTTRETKILGQISPPRSQSVGDWLTTSLCS